MRIDARPPRGERLNLGLVVLNDDSIDVHLARNLKKVHALSAALDETAIRDAASNLEIADDYVRSVSIVDSERLAMLGELTPFAFSTVGEFFVHSKESYDAEVTDLLRRLVEPEPAPVRARQKSSPLLSTVKSAFRQARVMAKKGEDLTAHRVIAGLSLAEGFSADLVLKNGAMHIIETVDASNPETALKKIIQDIAVSALTIEQARIQFEDTTIRGRLVYQASSRTEAAATPALDAAAHQGVELVNWASASDQSRFLNVITALAVPIERQSRKPQQRIHMSLQHKFQLN